MKLLIDATNLIAGGGLTHLQELLNHTKEKTLEDNNINIIYVVGVDNTLATIEDKPWIIKLHMDNFQDNFLKRNFWKFLNFKKIIKNNQIDLIFNPGGSYFTKLVPYVTMCRNMLVFEKEESARFGLTLTRLRFFLLRKFQSKSMKNAVGVIFISNYAKNYINDNHPSIINQNSQIIHHGISKRFQLSGKLQEDITAFSSERPFKLLYVSTLDLYKHHSKIAESIIRLVEWDSFPLELTIVGGKAGGYPSFEKVMQKRPDLIKYYGKVPFERVQEFYHLSDAFIFGSTCENMPNILIEAMTSGLPIICSQKQPMPEFLGEGGLYFDVECDTSIDGVLKNFILNKEVREKKQIISKELASRYSWEKCSVETFEFLGKSYENYKLISN